MLAIAGSLELSLEVPPRGGSDSVDGLIDDAAAAAGVVVDVVVAVVVSAVEDDSGGASVVSGGNGGASELAPACPSLGLDLLSGWGAACSSVTVALGDALVVVGCCSAAPGYCELVSGCVEVSVLALGSLAVEEAGSAEAVVLLEDSPGSSVLTAALSASDGATLVS